ncbi:Sugar Porter (MFS) [Blattamonas nauphoetae]|uniref:Sugar Porter (MFS) n=1 Tax=Blattamonas nauphoetae TaxID=2049346 RepID=A0ABQ9XDK0_9EUKA|nr:Sugar Porter (MFS) [Blattamonas nauphoetae]
MAESTHNGAAAFVSFVGGAAFGVSTGVIAGVLSEDRWNNIGDLSAFLSSSLLYGIVVGSLLNVIITDKIGRRVTLLVGAIIAAVFAVAMAFCHILWLMCMIRGFSGVGIGIITTLAPLYATELASTKRRGLIVGFFQVFITIGIFAGYCLNMAFHKVTDGWRYEFALTSLMPILLIVGFFFLPETDSWKAMRDAKKQNADNRPSFGQRTRFKFHVLKHYPRSIFVGVALSILYQMTGLNVVVYYTNSIFKEAGVDNLTLSLGLTMAIGVWNFICSLIPPFIVDKFGRRPFVIIGCVPMIIGMILLALSYQLTFQTRYVLAIVGMILFLGGFEFGLGPIYFIVINEMFPAEVRNLASASQNLIMWLCNIIIVHIFQPASKGMTPQGFFYLLAGLSLVLLLIVIFVMKETKGIETVFVEGVRESCRSSNAAVDSNELEQVSSPPPQQSPPESSPEAEQTAQSEEPDEGGKTNLVTSDVEPTERAE